MNEEKARELLEDYIRKDGGLFNGGSQYIHWKKGSSEVTLDDTFDIDFLEAVIWWVRNEQGKA